MIDLQEFEGISELRQGGVVREGHKVISNKKIKPGIEKSHNCTHFERTWPMKDS